MRITQSSPFAAHDPGCVYKSVAKIATVLGGSCPSGPFYYPLHTHGDMFGSDLSLRPQALQATVPMPLTQVAPALCPTADGLTPSQGMSQGLPILSRLSQVPTAPPPGRSSCILPIISTKGIQHLLTTIQRSS